MAHVSSDASTLGCWRRDSLAWPEGLAQIIFNDFIISKMGGTSQQETYPSIKEHICLDQEARKSQEDTEVVKDTPKKPSNTC